MPWARVDDQWWAHRKVLPLSLAARGLWTTCLSWSCAQRTDTVPDALVDMVGGDADTAGELEAAGLWIRVDGGWQIHDWAEYQEKSVSEKRAEAGAKGGRSSKQEANAKQNGSTDTSNGEANEQAGAPSRPVPAQPEEQPLVDADTSTVDDDGFNDFWTAYPRGPAGKPGGDGSKKKARQRWRRMTQQQRDQALVGVKHYAAYIAQPDAPRPCMATTWLNEQRWDQWQQPAQPSARNGIPTIGRDQPVDYFAGRPA